jgi:RNase P subunit RPR2
MKPITWRDLEQSEPAGRTRTTCRHCRRALVYRVSDRTYYRTDADAAEGRRPIRNCPGCGRSLYPRNLVH